MWTLTRTDEFEKRFRKWPKKYGRELAAMMQHLETVLDALRRGATVESIRTFGFVHSEPGQLLALDQKGGGTGLKQSRLYIYPDKSIEVVHVITMGFKKTQPSDIQFAVGVVAELIAESDEKAG